MFRTRPVVGDAADYAVVWLTGVVEPSVRKQIVESYHSIVLMHAPLLVVDVGGQQYLDCAAGWRAHRGKGGGRVAPGRRSSQ